MLNLALDTTATTATVALLENDEAVASFHINKELKHSETLLPMIDAVLNFVQKSIDEVELISISAGPGSFTGVRIGVSCAKGLSYDKNIPIASVSTLEALAENVRGFRNFEKEEVILCPSMDARRDELYNALFLFNGSEIKRITPDRAISCDDLQKELLSYNKTVYILGDGGRKLYDYLKDSNSGVQFYPVPKSICMQNAESVGRVGYHKYKEGGLINAEKLSCVYLRASQAERNLKEEKQK